MARDLIVHSGDEHSSLLLQPNNNKKQTAEELPA
jgi:hypothetical protein